MEKLTEKQKLLLEFLQENKDYSFTEKEIKSKLNIGKTVIIGLLNKGLIVEKSEKVDDCNYIINLDNICLNTLNTEQENVFNEIKDFSDNYTKFVSILLEGATGSGKTEVYFHLIADILRKNDNNQALFLIPEIALTTQLISRFNNQFKCDIAIWHSDISNAKKRDIWQGVNEGKIKVIIGARSALFLPFNDLKLIIVDEEHDGSYKQTDNGCYNARDMAVLRAKMLNIPIILGTATPSLETLVNVENNKYKRVFLENRFGNAVFPDVKLIDLRNEKLSKNSIISSYLKEKMQEHLKQKNQILLFLNKRGYSPLVLCRECGFKYSCPHCSCYLTNHKNKNKLICHQCGYVVSFSSTICPSCGRDSIISFGFGVEKIAEEVKNLFPDKNIAIITSDTVQNINRTKQVLDDILNKRIDIIVGTQIITKGYHFPDLTLLGVLDADASLFGGQFKAMEKTYQLLTQVIGRVGRGEKRGEAIIQTYSPENMVMKALVENDKNSIIEFDKENRQMIGLPPYGKMAVIILSGTSEEKVYKAAKDVLKIIPIDDNVEVLGPAPVFLYKYNDNFRFKIIVKTKNNINLQKLLRYVLEKINLGNVRMKIDVNPNNIP